MDHANIIEKFIMLILLFMMFLYVLSTPLFVLIGSTFGSNKLSERLPISKDTHDHRLDRWSN